MNELKKEQIESFFDSLESIRLTIDSLKHSEHDEDRNKNYCTKSNRIFEASRTEKRLKHEMTISEMKKATDVILQKVRESHLDCMEKL